MKSLKFLLKGAGDGAHDEKAGPPPTEALPIPPRWNPVSGDTARAHKVKTLTLSGKICHQVKYH